MTGGVDFTGRLWSLATGNEIRHFVFGDGAILGLAFSPDGKYLATTSGSFLSLAHLWTTEMPPGETRFIGHTAGLWRAIVSKDGKRVLTAGDDGTARIWDSATGQELKRFGGRSNPPRDFRSAVFSPDEKYVLTCGNDNTSRGYARLWDAQTAELVLTYTGHTDLVRMAAFSPDGQYVVTTSADGTARTWEALTGRNIMTFTNQMGDDPDDPNNVNRVMFSPDGKTVVTSGTDQTARIWNPMTGEELHVLRGHTASVSGVGFSPNGKYVVTGSDDGTARLWDAQTGKELRQFLGHAGIVYGAQFSPDGNYILTGGADQTARLWEVATGREVRRFSGQSGLILDVDFSPDGQTILTASKDGTARIWYTDYHDTIRYLCAQLTRDLTDEERAQYNVTDQQPTCPRP
jgi:WD40 repeat protein